MKDRDGHDRELLECVLQCDGEEDMNPADAGRPPVRASTQTDGVAGTPFIAETPGSAFQETCKEGIGNAISMRSSNDGETVKQGKKIVSVGENIKPSQKKGFTVDRQLP